MFNAVDEMPDGEGIPPQMLDHLFEAFATFGKARGTSLGLSISKRIIEEHHGRIHARNVPGGGALFGFCLPPRPAQPLPPPAIELAAQ